MTFEGRGLGGTSAERWGHTVLGKAAWAASRAAVLTRERRAVGREGQLVGDGFGSGVVVHVLPGAGGQSRRGAAQ